MTIRVTLDVSAVPARPAGAGQYILALAGALSVRPDIDLVLISRKGDDGRWTIVAPAAEVVAIAPQARPVRLVWEQSVLPVVIARRHPDVHHAPHYTMPELARVPCVVTIHDLTFFDHPEWHERSKVPVFRRAIKVAAREAAALVCVSEYTANRLREIVTPAGPVFVVPHGLDHDRFRPGMPGEEAPDEAALASLGVRPPYIAFLGTIEPRKSVDHLVRAFDRMAKAHPDLQLVLAGGAGWGVEAVDRAIAGARHGDRVVRTGYVPDAVVPALFRRAAAVAYPAAEEGFGIPALEALACEAPLVTTKGTVMEEVVGEAALLVGAGDTEALSGALDMLVRGDARLDGRRALGREIAARHTWARCAEGHVAAYEAARR